MKAWIKREAREGRSSGVQWEIVRTGFRGEGGEWVEPILCFSEEDWRD